MSSVGAEKAVTRPFSSETSVATPPGPHPKFPTNAPVEVWTLGTTPVRSISFTVTAGEAEGVNSAIALSFS